MHTFLAYSITAPVKSFGAVLFFLKAPVVRLCLMSFLFRQRSEFVELAIDEFDRFACFSNWLKWLPDIFEKEDFFFLRCSLLSTRKRWFRVPKKQISENGPNSRDFWKHNAELSAFSCGRRGKGRISREYDGDIAFSRMHTFENGKKTEICVS